MHNPVTNVAHKPNSRTFLSGPISRWVDVPTSGRNPTSTSTPHEAASTPSAPPAIEMNEDFREHLARQPGSARAERQAHREIPLSCGRAREEETREIGASHHQEHGDDCQHRPHRFAVPIAKFGQAG